MLTFGSNFFTVRNIGKGLFMLSFCLFISVAALIDSANPLNIATHIYLLGTPKPVLRVCTFLIGIYVTYFIIGTCIAFFLYDFVDDFFRNPQLIDYIFGSIIGLILIGFGLYTFHKERRKVHHEKKPFSLKPMGTFFLGTLITIANLPTVFPYLAAIDQMLKEDLELFEILSAIWWYNVLYISPLLVLFVIYLILRRKSEHLLIITKDFVDKWGGRAMAVLFMGLGVYLLVDTAIFLFNGIAT